MSHSGQWKHISQSSGLMPPAEEPGRLLESQLWSWGWALLGLLGQGVQGPKLPGSC